ncbi:hypothetical protein NKG94_26255 [Micromonospora sp. M12]
MGRPVRGARLPGAVRSPSRSRDLPEALTQTDVGDALTGLAERGLAAPARLLRPTRPARPSPRPWTSTSSNGASSPTASTRPTATSCRRAGTLAGRPLVAYHPPPRRAGGDLRGAAHRPGGPSGSGAGEPRLRTTRSVLAGRTRRVAALPGLPARQPAARRDCRLGGRPADSDCPIVPAPAYARRRCAASPAAAPTVCTRPCWSPSPTCGTGWCT